MFDPQLNISTETLMKFKDKSCCFTNMTVFFIELAGMFIVVPSVLGRNKKVWLKRFSSAEVLCSKI